MTSTTTLSVVLCEADGTSVPVEVAGIEAAHKLIFGGTLPTIGGFNFGQRFEVELHDPVLDRSLTCAYDVILGV